VDHVWLSQRFINQVRQCTAAGAGKYLPFVGSFSLFALCNVIFILPVNLMGLPATSMDIIFINYASFALSSLSSTAD
jgi:hypothetical protein